MEQPNYQDLFMGRGIQLPPQSTPGYKPNREVNLSPFMGGGIMPWGLGSILTQIFGPQMWPLMNPNSQSSLYDAAWQRNKDIQTMDLTSDTVSSWFPLKNLGGLNKDSVITQMATRMMSDPDGIAAKFMAPILGGNPIAAQMSSFADLQGIGASALGNGRGVNVNQLKDALDSFNKYYYKQPDEGAGMGGDTDISARSIRALGDEFTKSLKTTAGDTAKAYSPIAKGAIETAIRGMNFSNNLGLSVNTLLTARDAMITNRLFTPTSDIPNLNKLSALAGGAEGGRLPSLITAAKGLWGNGMNDKELMQNMSDLIGTSSFNVADPNDTTRLETLLRQFKSTARESNIDLNTMLGITSQAQGIASQNPALKGLGGEDITKMVMNAAQQTAVMATSQSPENNWVTRSQGGTMGLFRNMVQNTLDAASNPTISASAGVRTYIKEKLGDNTVAGKNMLAKYDSWASGQSGFPMNQAGLMGWMQNNFAGTDLSADKAWQYSYMNPTAAAVAYEDFGKSHPDSQGLLSHITNGMQMGSLRLKIRARMGAAGLRRLDALIKSNSLKDIEIDPLLNSDSAAGPNSVSAMLHRAIDSGVLTEAAINANPELRANRKVEQEAISTGALLDQTIDRKMGKMRPDALTRLAQSFASGDYSKEGVLKPFLSAIGVSPEGQNLQTMTDMSAQLNKLNGANTIADIASNVNWKDSEKLTQVSSVATKYGLNAEQLRGIANGDDISKYLNPSQMPTNATDKNAIQVAAKNFAGMDNLKDYNGTLDVTGLKTFAKNNLTKKSLEKIWGNIGIGKAFDNMVTSELGVMHGPKATAANKQLAEAVRLMSKDGKGGVDYLKGLNDISKMTTESIVDIGTDGKKATLPDSMKNFLKTFKNSDGTYKQGVLSPDLIANLNKGGKDFNFDTDTAKSVLSSVDSVVQSNPFLSGLEIQAGSVKGQHDSFVGTGDNKKDMPTVLNDILNKMSGIDSIASAIKTLNDTLGGTAHP